MTFGRLSELFDVNMDALFNPGKPKSGCFGEVEKEGEQSFYIQNRTAKDSENKTTYITKKVFCKYTKENDYEKAKIDFLKYFKERRLALERAIYVYIAEGPFSTSSFEVRVKYIYLDII